MQSQLFHVSPHLLRGSQAHFDFYSSPFYETGINAFDQGITESVLEFSYRVVPHFLWQVYAVENLDFNTGSAADFTISTVFTYRFDPGSNRQ
jgi:hypothetical protein